MLNKQFSSPLSGEEPAPHSLGGARRADGGYLASKPNKFIKILKFFYKFIVNTFTILALTAVIILAVGFASLNAKLVAVNYYIGTAQISLALLLVVCLGAGILLGALALAPSLIQLKFFNKRLEKYIKRTEEALEKIKALQTSANANDKNVGR